MIVDRLVQILALQLPLRSLIRHGASYPGACLARCRPCHCPSVLASNTSSQEVLASSGKNWSCGGCISQVAAPLFVPGAPSTQGTQAPRTAARAAHAAAQTPSSLSAATVGAVASTGVGLRQQSQVEIHPARSLGGSLVSLFRGLAAELL